MGETVADTIRELTRRHIAENNGLVLGQCLSAVGWVQNTVPEQEAGIEELPMTDTAGAGIAVGAALTGRRPIFILRFQSLVWLNASPLVNHAARVKAIFGYGCPLFIRASGDEGHSMGPVHSGAHHAPFMYVPGLTVVAPMTPGEYRDIWAHFMAHDDPLFVSEHRLSYNNTEELPDRIEDGADITLFAASASRFSLAEAAARLREDGIRVNIVHLVWLKPLNVPEAALAALRASGNGLVLDSGFEICGASRSIAYELTHLTGVRVHALALEDRPSGVAKRLENLSPQPERIVKEVRNILAE
ncbi:MAG: transketolase C-terminal domain-containing protein [Alphaproteobacteria bacterium]